MQQTCHTCHKIFQIKPSAVAKGNGKFCSRACWRLSINKTSRQICAWCGKSFEARLNINRQQPARYCSEPCCKAAAYRRNHDHNLLRERLRYQAQSEREKSYQKHYRRNNPEKVKALQSRYAETHRNEKHTYNSAYRLQHREALKIYQREYRQAHTLERNIYHQRRRARKKQAPVNDLTAAQWSTIKAAYGHRCVYCQRKMQHLTQDHITPLSKGGSHTVQNVVPACASCNSKKGAGAILTPVQPLLL